MNLLFRGVEKLCSAPTFVSGIKVFHELSSLTGPILTTYGSVLACTVISELRVSGRNWSKVSLSSISHDLLQVEYKMTYLKNDLNLMPI
jgi:hypothetical protein